MLIKNIRNIMASAAGVALATSAMADHHMPKTATVAGQFRSEMTYNDDGLAKINDGGKPSSTTLLDVKDVRLYVKGMLNDKATYDFGFDFLQADSSDLVYNAIVNWKVSEMVSMTLGKDYVRQGGYSNSDNVFINNWGDRAQTLAFDRTANAVSLHYAPNSMHNMTVQLVNDIIDDPATDDSEALYNTSHKQPAAILEYTGEFGAIKPLVQYGQYDMNHSSFWNVGARAKFGATALTFDYGANSMSMPVGTADKAVVFNNMTLRAEHDMGSLAPFFWYNSYNRVDKEITGTEDKTNAAGEWYDNATQISVGTSFKSFGDNFAPYVAYRMKSGKFLNSANKEKTGSEGQLAVGLAGNF